MLNQFYKIMKYRAITIILMVLLFYSAMSFNTQEEWKQLYNNGQLKFQVSIENGMFNGNYISWYSNGKKKAEGTFKNNQRIGTWTVYDTLEHERMIRKYENNFQFQVVEAKNIEGEKIWLPEKINYDLIKDKTGCYKYSELLEKDVVVSKRVWRIIESNPTNAVLFENNRLWLAILNNIVKTKKIKSSVSLMNLQKS
jgi:hypothetical protein